MSRIYVASLAHYNAGALVGKWFDLSDFEDIDALSASVAVWLKGLEVEEFAIHDFEGFGGLLIDEYDSLAYAFAVHEAIEVHGAVFAIYVAHVFGTTHEIEDIAEAASRFVDVYRGEQTALDYAREYVDECIFEPTTPEVLRTYFDYESFARDLLLSGDMTEVTEGGTTYLFDNNA